MKTIPNGLAAHLACEVLTLASCWKLTRRDNVVMGFTSHDQDLVVDGVTYEAASGFTPSAVAGSASLSVDNLEIEGMLDSAHINEADLLAGKYDFAEILVFQVNYQDITSGKLVLRKGWIGEISLRNQRFTAEVRGLTQKLSQNVGELYSAGCRAGLGDARCKVSLAGFTKTGVITGVSSRNVFTDNARTELADYFQGGVITFVSGDNTGIAMEIKEYNNGVFVTALPLAFDVLVGDHYSAVAGCDKRFSTCVSRFGNAVNFTGEPHVPGLDRMLETAGTRSVW